MKTAVISDIHGNLEALTAVLSRLAICSVDQIISLGDNIGYGPDPNAVMTLLARNGVLSILGNHEIAIKHPRFLNWFNPVARKSVVATASTLSPEHIKAIHSWTPVLTTDLLRFVHGVPPASPFLYPFQLSDRALGRKLLRMTQPICFCGHTHELEMIHASPGGDVSRLPLGRGKSTLDKNLKYLINAGSVGQPREENKDAKLILFDDTDQTLEVQYVPYPYKITAQKIRDAGMPDVFARRLCP